MKVEQRFGEIIRQKRVQCCETDEKKLECSVVFAKLRRFNLG